MRTIALESALRFPLQGKGWPRTMLIGGGTGLLLQSIAAGLGFLVFEDGTLRATPIVVAANLPGLGYVLQTYRFTLGQQGILPEWQDWRAILRSGAITATVLLAYGVLPVVLLLLGLGWLVRGGWLLAPGMILIVTAVLAGLISFFFLPMALARYVLEERLEAAFHLVRLWEAIDRVLAPYLRAYLISIGSYLVAAVLAAIPYLGAVVWPFLWFYLAMTQTLLFADACAE